MRIVTERQDFALPVGQAEAIAFDATEEDLIITNEQRQIYRVPMTDLIEVAGPRF